MKDLGHAFGCFIQNNFETIHGCLVEKLSGGKYKWQDAIGTRDEIEKAIKDSGIILQNSIKNKDDGF